MLRSIRKIVIVILIVVLGVAAALPWGVYAFALANINGRPVPPKKIDVSEVESKELWAELREVEPVKVEKLTPYRYVPFLLGIGDNEQKPGEYLAWFVARDYTGENLNSKKTLYWHLSGAALTIWLTRNWSTEQLLVKAKEIVQKKKAASNNTLNRTRATTARAG